MDSQAYTDSAQGTIDQMQRRITHLELKSERLEEDNKRLSVRKSHKVKYPQFVMFYHEGGLSYGEILEQKPGAIKVKSVYPQLVEETTVTEIYSLNWLLDKVSSLAIKLSSAEYDLLLKEQENMSVLLQLRETELELAKYKNAEAT